MRGWLANRLSNKKNTGPQPDTFDATPRNSEHPGIHIAGYENPAAIGLYHDCGTVMMMLNSPDYGTTVARAHDD